MSGEPGAAGHADGCDRPFRRAAGAVGRQGRVPRRQGAILRRLHAKDVKPTPDSPLQKLGIEKVPPIITTAVLLDAKTHLGKGKAMQPGRSHRGGHRGDAESARARQARPQAGDVLYIYTGWGDNWKDPDTEKFYYTKGPGPRLRRRQIHREKKVVLVALDNPFTDPVADGFLQGKAAPPAGAPDGLPFAIHHHNLTQSGIYQIQNANLGALAKDKVWLSCTMILPLRAQGDSGSPVRPVAIGAPSQ